jgi:hypothetical protein
MSYIIRTAEINAFVEDVDPIKWTIDIDAAKKFETEAKALKEIISEMTNVEVVEFDAAVEDYGNRYMVPDFTYLDSIREDHNLMPEDFEEPGVEVNV